MSIHRIRLRGPWRCDSLSAGLSARGRVQLPQSWRDLFGETPGRARFSRTFHRPTNLEPESRVHLIFEGIGGEAEISLNGQRIGESPSETAGEAPVRIEITNRLTPHNELQVDVQFDPAQSPAPGGLWGPVVLEIHEPNSAANPER